MTYYELREERERLFENMNKHRKRSIKLCNHITRNLLKGKKYLNKGKETIKKIEIKIEKYRIKYEIVTKEMFKKQAKELR